MIQRLQTVYLALVIILSFVGLISTIGEFSVQGNEIASFSNFTFNAFRPYEEYARSGPWCLGILLILIILISLLSIMLFRKRMRQLRLTIISTILLVGYVTTYILFTYYYYGGLELTHKGLNVDYHLPFVAVFPVLSIILNVLAIHGIRKDEALVRALDHLR